MEPETEFLGVADQEAGAPLAVFLMTLGGELESLWVYGKQLRERLEHQDGWSSEVAEATAADTMRGFYHLFMQRVASEIANYLDAEEEEEDGDEPE